MVRTTLGAYRRLTTPLCHDSFIISWFRSDVLIIILLFIFRCRSIKILWSKYLLFVFESWLVGITLLLPGLIPRLGPLVLKLFFVSQLLLLNLLHIEHQTRYIQVPIRHFIPYFLIRKTKLTVTYKLITLIMSSTMSEAYRDSLLKFSPYALQLVTPF